MMRREHRARTIALTSITLFAILMWPVAATASSSLTRVATVKPPNFGLFDLTWYGSPFGKPTVYLSDQPGVEAFNATSGAYLGTLGLNLFAPLSGGPADCGTQGGGAGPDGVLSLTVDGSNQVWAGNGNSTVKVFTLTSPSSGALGMTISTGGQCRADELSYDPIQHLVLIGNSTEPTANFASLISVNANPKMDKVVGKIAYPGATAGLEQSLYDPTNGEFYLNVVQTNPADNNVGSVDEISPKTKRVIRSIPIVGCRANGMALDQSANDMLLGCSSGNGLMIMNATTGALLHVVTQVSGADEVAYDATSQEFFVPAGTSAGSAVLAEVSAKTGNLVATVPLPANAFTHSAAAGGGKVFVPVEDQGLFVYSVEH
jgi:hypothetical protein